MKYIIALLGATVALRLNGIDKKELMQEQPSHWRKIWPEGDTDNADGDAEILDWFNHPEKHGKKKPKITYPWSFDEDVISTQDSISTAEGITNNTLHADAVKDGGLDMINVYDNTKRQFERNLPYGATW
mmetsp:Transcript_19668/g.30389  ORF Transcript_19668/g.30389 Transcript_19668/m.30389 type:complete len:129 (-) Transcript_19668:49-435(-)